LKTALLLLSFVALGVLAGCTSQESYHQDKYKEVKVTDVPEDIHIPPKAWDLLEGKVGGEAEKGGAEKNEAAKEPAKEAKGEENKLPGKEIVFSEVDVFLVEKNDDVLKDKAVKIHFPKGGGEIDLAQYMGKNPGSFFVGFDDPDFKDTKDKKVIFVSQTRKRRLDDQVYGGGCNQFFDITEHFFKNMKEQGLKVNSTRERHVTVLGGHFLFSAIKGNTVYIAQVTFKDSEHKNLFCEGL